MHKSNFLIQEAPVVRPSIASLLSNAIAVSEKSEKLATESLLKGESDKIIQLVTARQLTGLVRNIKIQYDGSSEVDRETDDFDYPNW